MFLFAAEHMVPFHKIVQWGAVGNQEIRVQFSTRDELHQQVAMDSVHAARLKDQIFSIHVWERKRLRLLVHGDQGHDGIRPGDLPRRLEGIRTARR